MALSASTVWEVRTAGSDTNGGGYVSGGTDWSQQDAAQYSVTDAVTAGTTTITSATANFGTEVVGNILYIQGGTAPITAGRYQIISRTNSTTIVVDRSTGLTAGTGATLKIGGALASPGLATGNSVTSNDIWIKSGTYSITSVTADIAGGRLNHKGGSQSNAGRIRGYHTARWSGIPTTTDLANKPLIQASGITNVVLCDSSAGNHGAYENIHADGASLTTMTGFSPSGSGTIRMQWCKASNCYKYGFQATGNSASFFIETTNCGTSNLYPAILANADVFGFYCSADRGLSIQPNAQGVTFINGIITGCLDAVLGSAYISQQRTKLINVTIYNGSAAGLQFTSANCEAINVISYGNVGSQFTAGASDDTLLLMNCAGVSGSVHANVVNSINFVTLTVNPFVNAAGGNFALNSTAGGGAACKAAGIPGAFPGGLTTGYIDIGAAQSQASGGGVRMVNIRGGADQ